MSSPTIKLSKFKQIAKAVASTVAEEKRDGREREKDEWRRTSSPISKSLLTIRGKSSAVGSYIDQKSSHVEGEFSLQGDHSLASSGEGSDTDRHDNKKGGLVYQKTENFWTRVRDMIAMSDVFISRGENPPFVACLQVSVWFIPLLLIMIIWDMLAVIAFEVPHLSTVNLPGFFLGWHFVMMMLAMYGFMLSYLSSGNSPRTKLAAISLGIHYLLLFCRTFMEIYFDGFRGQWKVYYERTKKIF